MNIKYHTEIDFKEREAEFSDFHYNLSKSIHDLLIKSNVNSIDELIVNSDGDKLITFASDKQEKQNYKITIEKIES